MQIRKKNEMYGVFSNVNEAKNFFLENGFFVLLMNPVLQKNPTVQKLQHQNRCFYSAVIISNSVGKENFKKMFHDRFTIPLQEEEEKNLLDTLHVEINLNISFLQTICLRTRILNEFGIFSIKDMQKSPQCILSFMKEKEYVIIDLDHEEEIRHNCIMALEEDVIGIVVSTKNMTKFKDTFHRSSEYVSSKTISTSVIKNLISKNLIAKELLENMENTGEIQFRVIKEIRIREKYVHYIHVGCTKRAQNFGVLFFCLKVANESLSYYLLIYFNIIGLKPPALAGHKNASGRKTPLPSGGQL